MILETIWSRHDPAPLCGAECRHDARDERMTFSKIALAVAVALALVLLGAVR